MSEQLLTSDAALHTRIYQACLSLDGWLDSQRQVHGFGGPVVHWWWDSLDYRGPGLDWRYEGIILGYINLWQATGEAAWLDKARQAGDDLLNGQLPSANFRNSQFELNPGSAGTPHEAACDLALLGLARALRAANQPGWQAYQAGAERNLSGFCIAKLWDVTALSFRDDPGMPCFVPNKAATLVEALFAQAELSGDSSLIECYGLPTLERILEHQVQGGELEGAIFQNSFGNRKVARFFPYYIARCLPALILAWQAYGIERCGEAARRAAAFILRTRYPDGSFPQVLYPRGRRNRYPQWIAGVGDILRGLDLARPLGIAYDEAPSLEWLLAGLLPKGGMRTARGFGWVTPGGREEDPRDALSVCGWVGMAFRYLSGRLVKEASL